MKSAQFVFDLMELIENKQLNGISIGDSFEMVQNAFGLEELPKARLKRQSKLYSHLYGNLSFISENNMIVSINIDLHGNRDVFVAINYEKKSVSEWMALFENKKWSIGNYGEVVLFNINGISLSFSLLGTLEMVSFT